MTTTENRGRSALDRRAVMAGAAALALAGTGRAGAQPATRPVKVMVGFPAGGGLDTMVRIIGEKVRETTGTSVIVENRPGTAGRLAAEAVARAEPDGATLLAAPIVVTAFYPFIYRTLPFDPMADLVPVTRFCTFQFALAVDPRLKIDSVPEFIAYAKSHPGKVSFGSLGAGTPSHFLGLMFSNATGTDLTHVPYRGSAPALQDLVGGSIQAVFDTTASLMPQHQAGTARVLAVTGTARSPRLPAVPTFGELKLGLGDIESADLWYGFFAPGRTSPDTVERLAATIRTALADATVRERLAGLDVTVVSDTPAGFAEIVKADHARWGKVIRASGFTLD
ncbi:tripartite tricarboxylate transporter substrate binding protein [Rhodoplanes sp. TEM]|uniref:Tripartite tricarboxylate transporter substrate binding protein n=1 Tax=Rhodoplanes tepidamans TaxID=200616 RepID=A0ABT5JC37_RHOTP|nr:MULTISPECIES: tripartite tricarboxylate transporter substrate binding protein [Rhodoplanes]MDC7786829.1 tripartite tricarboxylate transporter substrate binding protein [Rhodoplanes tepidamans]MDC7985971.1 tripartite tricarboxylate transporter substrate binding protein [Rhodoplanes sp. TEM]MDQ0355957.1 tripartite-type tricarboxylate transporter receptor subunit TctC [Rhodoplanes tepidamans]